MLSVLEETVASVPLTDGLEGGGVGVGIFPLESAEVSLLVVFFVSAGFGVGVGVAFGVGVAVAEPLVIET